jgi:hypothetical protein
MKGKEMYMPSSCGGFVTWLYIMWSLHMPWIRWNQLCPVVSLSLGNQWIWFPHYYYGWMTWILWKIGKNILIYWYYSIYLYIIWFNFDMRILLL